MHTKIVTINSTERHSKAKIKHCKSNDRHILNNERQHWVVYKLKPQFMDKKVHVLFKIWNRRKE